jgi:hypothetical protein
MKRFFPCFFLFYGLTGFADLSSVSLPQAVSPAETKFMKLNPKLWIFDHIEQNTVFFSNKTVTHPLKLKVNLFDIKYLGSIRNPRYEPYFLFLAKPCDTCEDQTSIYAIRPCVQKISSFISPGKILDPKTKQILLESRAFFGKCLMNEPSEVLIFFQKEKVDRKKSLQHSVLIAQPTEDFLREKLTERHHPSFAQTLTLVKKKGCTEIPGITRTVPNKPVSLKEMIIISEKTLEDSTNDTF